MPLQESVSPTTTNSCAHCGLPVPVARRSSFCCAGCETVFGLLQERGLGKQYYQLKEKRSWLRPSQPAIEATETFSFLNDPEVSKTYVQAAEEQEATRVAQFYLEGVHCAACVWLTEKLPEFLQGVESCRLDLSNSLATVRFSEDVALSEIATEFSRLGYRPHPARLDEVSELQKREERTMLIRMAVAGACSGNIMLMSVSLYAGANQELGELFRWTSFVLALPVLFYSATPFYKTALASFRTRQPSIDLPLALGVILAGAASFVNLLRGSAHIYFDSLAMLVFLILATRYLLRRAQQFALTSTRLIHFLMPATARIVEMKGETPGVREAPIVKLRPHDLVEVRPGEAIPADGEVEEGRSELNCSLLTGEPRPVQVNPGAQVFAGTLNLSSLLRVRVSRSGAASRLGAILQSVEESVNRRAPIVQLADRIAKWFVGAVILATFMMLGYGAAGSWDEALSRALAFVIVTCPCALALATPLAMNSTMGRAARAGILIKKAEAIEKLSSARTLFVDKTGTLTTGKFEVLSWELDPEAPEAADVLYALESRSNHPIARAITDALGKKQAWEVSDFREIFGKGVSGTVNGRQYRITADESAEDVTRVALWRDGDAKAIARVTLGDQLRPDSRDAIRKLLDRGLEVWILSGDNAGVVKKVARELGIPEERALGGLSPEAKSRIVEAHPGSIMVGDGANDAIALAQAGVGIAVHAGMEVSMRAAEAYQSRAGMMPLADLVEASDETLKIIRWNFGFSIAYNLLGGIAAVAGWVNPLVAAILMPISAFTVFIGSMTGTRKLRRFGQEVSV